MKKRCSMWRSCLAMKKEIERLEKLTGGVSGYLDNGGKSKPKGRPKALKDDDVRASKRKPQTKVSLEVGR